MAQGYTARKLWGWRVDPAILPPEFMFSLSDPSAQSPGAWLSSPPIAQASCRSLSDIPSAGGSVLAGGGAPGPQAGQLLQGEGRGLLRPPRCCRPWLCKCGLGGPGSLRRFPTAGPSVPRMSPHTSLSLSRGAGLGLAWPGRELKASPGCIPRGSSLQWLRGPQSQWAMGVRGRGQAGTWGSLGWAGEERRGNGCRGCRQD